MFFEEDEAREKAIRDYNWQMKSNWNAGHNAGVQQGKIDAYKELLRDGLITPEEAAKRPQISRQEVEKLMKERAGEGSLSVSDK